VINTLINALQGHTVTKEDGYLQHNLLKTRALKIVLMLLRITQKLLVYPEDTLTKHKNSMGISKNIMFASKGIRVFQNAHYLSTLVNLTLIILYLELLNFSKTIFSKSKNYCER
jgi:hypothetical protein